MPAGADAEAMETLLAACLGIDRPRRARSGGYWLFLFASPSRVAGCVFWSR
ncbi:MAG: hypothetical protein U0793_17410 [Gemmataceae bacterium]